MNILWWCFSIFAVESFRSCTTAIFVLPNCFWHISPAFFWKVISLGGHGSGSDSWQSVFESILCLVVLPSCVNTSFRPSHPNFRRSVFNLMSLHLEQLPSVNKVDYTFRTNIRLWLWYFQRFFSQVLLPFYSKMLGSVCDGVSLYIPYKFCPGIIISENSCTSNFDMKRLTSFKNHQ